MNKPMNNSSPEPNHRGSKLPVDNSAEHPIVPSLRYRIALALLVLMIVAGLALIMASG